MTIFLIRELSEEYANEIAAVAAKLFITDVCINRVNPINVPSFIMLVTNQGSAMTVNDRGCFTDFSQAVFINRVIDHLPIPSCFH